jgi:ATP-dependent exoDNAse (exonuclease V) beta subunit
LGPFDLAAFGKKNADELLSFFPKPSRNDHWADLLIAVDRAIAQIQANDDNTKGTQNYLNDLLSLQPAIRENRLTWRFWVKLSKSWPRKKSEHLAEPVVNAALAYDRHPMLHDNIKEFCTKFFKIAADALEHYQTLKQQRGLIDFVDQEQLMLAALDNPDVTDVLREELDLLLVDEFQDTSPIQLALFLKLSGVAKEAVFVGDVKQAIYGFRGSDPELMQAVLEEVKKQGGVTDILEKSWRSRPALISYTNALFIPAFSNIIPEEQVFLTPQRKEKTTETAVERWVLKGKNKNLRAAALALGVQDLVRSDRKVIEKATDTPRPILFEDIAVLARTHDNVASIAGALVSIGIPVQIERAGLLDTPEGCLSLACLRRMADTKDTLASAEIIVLSDCKEPESWLKNRLKYLKDGHPSYLWGEHKAYEHHIIKTIANHRDRLEILSPSEAVAYVINIGDIRRIVTAWGPTDWRVRQRLKNLDALVNLAIEYEEHCRTQLQAATIAGLIQWLYDLNKAELDLQPGDPKADAVHVLTHHAAKGLEWPVVISTDLDFKLRSRIWGLNIESEKDSIDLKNPLSDRFIRYWPWPFGAQKKGIEVADKIGSSAIGIACQTREIEEAKRLLYVSMTRARDLLIMPLPEVKKTETWMETLNSDWMLPVDSKMLLPDGTKIPTACRLFDAQDSEAYFELPAYQPYWFVPREEKTEKLPALLHPSLMDRVKDAKIVDSKKIGMQLDLKGSPNMNQIGQAMHNLFAAEIINNSQDDSLSTAAGIIERFGVEKYLEPKDAVSYTKFFVNHVKSIFNPLAIYAEYPVQNLLNNGQLVKGWIDVLMNTNDGWVILDHKFTNKKNDKFDSEILKYSGQLLAYKEAIVANMEGEVKKTCIHLPLTGQIISISF